MTKINVLKSIQIATLGLFAVAGLAVAQDPSTPASPTGGWRKVGDAPAAQTAQAQTPTQPISSSAPNDQGAAPATYPESNYPQAQPNVQAQQPASQPAPPMPSAPPQQSQYPVQRPMQQQPMQQAPMQQTGTNYPPIPAQINVPAGTYITVRVNQRLSSNQNQPGDAFSATLVRPLVANGVVVAEPGQTIGGRVSVAEKAGRVTGVAKLGIELTDLALVDGQQLPVKTTLISRAGNTSVGRDAGAIATTTGLGAAVGAAADWGRGAAIGAGAGAAVGIIGVLVTRGEPSVIYPEQTLTFKIEQPLTVSTVNSPMAFRYVQPNEYSQQTAGYPVRTPAPGYAVAPAPYYGPYPYYAYGYGYPYYPFGGFSVFVGRGFYGPRGFRR